MTISYNNTTLNNAITVATLRETMEAELVVEA
jgi:hypothetical protein